MPKYNYTYVDDVEKSVTGSVEARNTAHAAVLIMGECGSGERRRFARHSPAVKEERLMLAADTELVSFLRLNVLYLEIKKAGSRKRKALEFTA